MYNLTCRLDGMADTTIATRKGCFSRQSAGQPHQGELAGGARSWGQAEMMEETRQRESDDMQDTEGEQPTP